MRSTFTVLLIFLTTALPAYAQSLDIYFIDVEGGQATLYIAPSGETMLVDTGFPGERDHARIVEVIELAGVEQIDHLVLTHYHIDHVGGLEALSNRIPIRNFYDHGPSPESDRPAIQAAERTYAEIYSRGERTIVRPGDTIPFNGVDVLVVASHDEFLETPIPGAPGAGSPNPACETFSELGIPESDPDNDYSVGFVLTHGAFRTINLGDLTWDREPRLMCPNNPVGTVDVYLTSHHGLDRSGSEVLVHGIQPRVAIMNNGPRKGGNVSAFEILFQTPGLEDVWQLHWSHHGGVEYNTPGAFIANIDDADTLAAVLHAAEAGGGPVTANQGHTPAHWIKLSARPDGSFTVTNSRNDFSKAYSPRSG